MPESPILLPSNLKVSLQNVVQFPQASIKILLSHPDREFHENWVPKLTDFLKQHLKKNIQIISKFTAWETFCSASDNVFDLVILSPYYREKDMTCFELHSEIKKLDKSISILVVEEKTKGLFQPVLAKIS